MAPPRCKRLPPPDASQDDRNHNIRRIDLATREVSTVAGNGARGFRDGVGTNAQFYRPWGIDIARSGGFAIVAVRAWPAPPRRAIPRIASSPPRTRCRPHRFPSHLATPCPA